jgi:hypothetical protein
MVKFDKAFSKIFSLKERSPSVIVYGARPLRPVLKNEELL